MSQETERINSKEESSNGIVNFVTLPQGKILYKSDLARLFDRCDTTIDRAVERGELPPPVRMFGQQVWTSEVILKHLEAMLKNAKQQAEDEEARMKRKSPRG